MNRYSLIQRAQRAARWLTERVHRLRAYNGRVTRMGTLPIAARIALWAVGVVAVGLFIVLAFWLAAVAVLAWIAFKVLRIGASASYAGFESRDPNDHREPRIYDSVAYHESRDPRFNPK